MKRERRKIPVERARQVAAKAAQLLGQDSRVLLVYLFGSAAHGEAASVRDVDLAVLTDTGLSLDELVMRRAELVAGAGTSIDLVSLNDASVVLMHEVVESGECLFARSPDLETEFVVRARARFWDFRPFREEQWRLAGERLQEREIGS